GTSGVARARHGPAVGGTPRAVSCSWRNAAVLRLRAAVHPAGPASARRCMGARDRGAVATRVCWRANLVHAGRAEDTGRPRARHAATRAPTCAGRRLALSELL